MSLIGPKSGFVIPIDITLFQKEVYKGLGCNVQFLCCVPKVGKEVAVNKSVEILYFGLVLLNLGLQLLKLSGKADDGIRVHQ